MRRVLILYNEPVLPPHHPHAESEREVLSTVEFVNRSLAEGGFEVSRLGIGHDPIALLLGIQKHQPDVVFNLFEGTADQASTEAYVAGLLEWVRVPFTGCPSQALLLARGKHLTKRLFRDAGLPTADFFVVEKVPVPRCRLPWPVIVKPALEDASVGVDQGSVVTSQAQLDARVALLLKDHGPPVLVEQFIRGRELDAALVEASDLRVLPISEIQFLEKDPNYWPIVTYAGKWDPQSRDYQATPPCCPAELSPALAERLGTLAKRAFRLLGCRDYARVDFRVDAAGKPYLLEVNPNPDFHPTAGFAAALTAAGVTHAQFAVDLVRNAVKRNDEWQMTNSE